MAARFFGRCSGFVLGRARSLMAATIVGFVGVAGLIALAVWAQSAWFGVLAAFILMNCWSGLQQARALLRVENLPRRDGFACPRAKRRRPWALLDLRSVQERFDTFQTSAVCPNCSAHFATTRCLDCGALHRIDEWSVPEPVPSPL